MRTAGLERVNVAPLREAFEHGPMTATEVAHAIGWRHSRGRADVSRLERALGLRADSSTSNRCTSSGGQHYTSTRTTIPVDTALLIADALGLDPVDVGL